MPVIQVRSEGEYETVLSKNENKLTIVDFTAKWCGPCQKIAPFYEKLSETYRQCVFLKVDVDENQEIAMANNVAAMPTFILVKKHKEVDRVRGADPDALEAKVKQHGGPAGVESFSGSGQKLGGESGPAAPTTNVPVTSINTEKAQQALNVDSSKPVTKVNVRLVDGARFTVTLNLTHSISNLREFVCAVRPEQASTCFKFITTFPNKTLEDEELTIEQANLSNAVIFQKITS